MDYVVPLQNSNKEDNSTWLFKVGLIGVFRTQLNIVDGPFS